MKKKEEETKKKYIYCKVPNEKLLFVADKHVRDAEEHPKETSHITSGREKGLKIDLNIATRGLYYSEALIKGDFPSTKGKMK